MTLQQQVPCRYSGPVFFTNFLKIAMLQVVLDWQKIYKAVLEKAFFFVFWRFKL
jgi:hypothetical protein